MKTEKPGQHRQAELKSLILQPGLSKYALSSHSGNMSDKGALLKNLFIGIKCKQKRVLKFF